jgi:hypothetical protein
VAYDSSAFYLLDRDGDAYMGDQYPHLVDAVHTLRPFFESRHEAAGTDDPDATLQGLSFGVDGLRHAWRFYVSDSGADVLIQKNNGTDNVPNWSSGLSFGGDGDSLTIEDLAVTDQLDAAHADFGTGHADHFYISELQVDFLGGSFTREIETVRETQATGTRFSHVDTLNFDANDFYLTGDSSGNPVISLVQDRAGRALSFLKTSAVEWIVQHNFGVVPVAWQLFSDGQEAFWPDKADVSDPNTAYFYFTNPVAGHALISTGALGQQALGLRVTISDGVTEVDTDTITFNSAEFDVTLGGNVALVETGIDHGSISGLSDNDHPQYLLRDGSASMTGDLNLGGKDVLNAAAGIFRDKVRAEAFYLETGGELITGITVRESDGTPPSFVSETLVFNSENFYLDATSAGKPQVNLRPRIYGQVGAFTKQQYAVAAALTIGGGNVAWNLDDAQVATLVLSSSATLQNPTNIKTGGQYTLIVTQTGSNTLSFGTAYKFGDAGAPSLSTSAGERDALVFLGFGTEMFLVGVSTGF